MSATRSRGRPRRRLRRRSRPRSCFAAKLGDRADITLVSDQRRLPVQAEHDLHPVRRRPGDAPDPARPADRASATSPSCTGVGRSTRDAQRSSSPAGTSPTTTSSRDRRGHARRTRYRASPSTPRRSGRRRRCLARRAARAGCVDDARRRERQRVLFLVPPNNKCAGPLYEMVLMLETWLRRQGARDACRPHLDHLRGRLHPGVRPAPPRGRRRGVRRARHRRPHRLRVERGRRRRGPLRERRDARASTCWSRSRPTSRRVAPTACRPTSAASSTTEPGSRRVRGTRRSTRPATPATSRSSRRSSPSCRPTPPPSTSPRDPRHGRPRAASTRSSMCVMEEFDKATFAQVPLRLTGDPGKAGRGAARARGALQGRLLAGLAARQEDARALPAVALRAGQPVPCRRAWKAMELGLKAMSDILARR